MHAPEVQPLEADSKARCASTAAWQGRVGFVRDQAAFAGIWLWGHFHTSYLLHAQPVAAAPIWSESTLK